MDSIVSVSNRRMSIVFNIIFIVLLVSSLLLVGIAFPSLRIGGMVPTIYRVAVPCIALFLVLVRCNRIRRGVNRDDIHFPKPVGAFLIIIVCWIIYGFVQLHFSSWVDIHDGIKQLLSIFLGGLLVYCFYELSQIHGWQLVVTRTIKVILVLFCLMALFEIATGFHLNTSRFYDVFVFMQNSKETILLPRVATGIFYNENDFSTALGILVPIVFVDKKTGIGNKIFDAALLIITGLIIVKNDSWIVFFSIVIALIMYLIITKAKIYEWAISGCIIIVMQQWGQNFLGKALGSLGDLIVKLGIFESKYYAYLTNSENDFSFKDVVKVQVEGAYASDSFGSLSTRLQVYVSDIKAVIASKGIGVGPSAVGSYNKVMSSDLSASDPHSLWLEILSEYGILIFAAFVGICIFFFIKLFKMYKETKNRMSVVSICVCIVFVFAANAPSTFLGSSFQWFPIALTVATLYGVKEKNPHELYHTFS